jgi:hypothetical protein
MVVAAPNSMNTLRTGLIALLFAATLPACVVDGDTDSTLLVENASDFAIVELYLTDVGSSSWGPNQIAGDILAPGESVLLVNIECDVYDALLVDETGAECELRSIDLCLDDATWIITNNTCDIFAAQD